MKRLSIFFFLLVFISSCKTFDFAKRRYNNGYYVDADGKQTLVQTPRKTADVEKAVAVKETEKNISEIKAEEQLFPSENYEVPSVKVENTIASSETNIKTQKTTLFIPKVIFKALDNSKRLEFFSVLSFIIGLCAILGVYVWGIFAAALLAILLGIIGRARIRNHLERYKAKKLWAVGVAFGVIILIYMIIVLATTNDSTVSLF